MNMFMIDLETLDTKSTATILQIGACKFDSESILSTFQYTVDIESQKESTICPATLKWWINQRNVPISQHGASIKEALTSFNSWLVAKGATVADTEVWCKGTDFDLPILKHAYHTYKKEDPPWKYNAGRDCRTVFKVFAHIKVPEENMFKHDALADAIHQTKQLQTIFKEVRNANDSSSIA